jgi:prepilin-type N-terminal cleavage/methylation domain-containing protein
MINKLRVRAQSESGFTLVELLVVMLILGLLAAIAIPSFFNQRDKAKDADAKELVRTAQTSIETYATDNGGAYTGATPAALIAIEQTLNNADGGDGSGNGDALAVSGLAADEYTVTVTSETGNVFNIVREDTGEVNFTCTTGGQDGCPTGGNWD